MSTGFQCFVSQQLLNDDRGIRGLEDFQQLIIFQEF